MAFFHGNKSQYLINQDFKHSIIGLLIVIGLFPLWYLWFVRFHNVYYTTTGFVVLAVIFGPIFYYAYKKINWHEKISDQFFRGRKGEYAVFYALTKLPDTYEVFQDVQAGRGNIDFVVVGPTGIYTIEVKSHVGNVTYDAKKFLLLRNGYPFEKDFLKQAWAETYTVRDFLKDKTSRDFRPEPILVFSNRRTTMKFGTNSVNGVYVIGINWLTNLLQSDGPQKYDSNIVGVVSKALS